jgi:hypothetical protein
MSFPLSGGDFNPDSVSNIAQFPARSSVRVGLAFGCIFVRSALIGGRKVRIS